ncbi:MAG: FAD-binding oxidoreductase [Bacteroidota bacterium]
MKLHAWGNYPEVDALIYYYRGQTDLSPMLNTRAPFIAFGNGRSYGDSALSEKVLRMTQHNRMLSFDNELGKLTCESGLLLSDIIKVFLPRGWFLQVTPGTKLITVGGAIAADIHGKNHHQLGCFSSCVESFKLVLPDDRIVSCSEKENTDLFRATCGGMGLTGIIIEATLFLKKVQSSKISQTTIKNADLEQTFEAFEKYKNSPYSVAWIDCLAKGKSMGRSLLMCGEFLTDGHLDYREKKSMNVPRFFPAFLLNALTVRVFNFVYYNKVVNRITTKDVSVDSFFYPLDAIKNWNRVYGKNGFVQYQFILPKDNSFEGLREILHIIAESGKGSFLAVLKLYGEENENYLSFPIEGYSLALDFKIENGLFELLNELDILVLKYSGRIYLAKDARVSKEVFEKGYPKITVFRDLRDRFGMKNIFSSRQSERLGL